MNLRRAYVGLSEIRKRSLDSTLDHQFIEQVESLFNLELENVKNIDVSDKYLKKYYGALLAFWEAPVYFRGNQLSRGKFNLFQSLKENDVNSKGFSDQECAFVLQKLETYWIASNQLYTKYLINFINKGYKR